MPSEHSSLTLAASLTASLIEEERLLVELVAAVNRSEFDEVIRLSKSIARLWASHEEMAGKLEPVVASNADSHRRATFKQAPVGEGSKRKLTGHSKPWDR